MTKWIRFENSGKTGFGTLEGDTIAVHTGDMFAGAKPTGETLKLSDVAVRSQACAGKAALIGLRGLGTARGFTALLGWDQR